MRVLASLVMMGVGLCGAAGAQGQQVTAEAIAAAISGNTVSGRSSQNAEFHWHARTGSTCAIYSLGERGIARDTCKWHVKSNQWCSQYLQFFSGNEVCVIVTRLDAESIDYTLASGSVVRAKIRKGNPEGL